MLELLTFQIALNGTPDIFLGLELSHLFTRFINSLSIFQKYLENTN